jgi:hypothetical protein
MGMLAVSTVVNKKLDMEQKCLRCVLDPSFALSVLSYDIIIYIAQNEHDGRRQAFIDIAEVVSLYPPYKLLSVIETQCPQ